MTELTLSVGTGTVVCQAICSEWIGDGHGFGQDFGGVGGLLLPKALGSLYHLAESLIR
ncbi:MAG: hypothetical protein FD149_250 [Rhodospirillaceae bacterium]|nr:MAG: hypothetical protein FD149_250 [Rhodospirillaceae bacterium]